nr:PREDICTED: malate dehydrogenase, cytoplasmic-like isoform X2 [Megachile rotundata]
MDSRKNESINGGVDDTKDVLKIVVTDGTTELALTFLYRILYDNVFGENQLVFISIFEFQDKALFLESVEIELTSFSPNLLQGISYGHDPSVQFKDADVVVCIGRAREYEFTEDEYWDPFFKDYILTSKYYGEAIENYAKKDARIIVIGSTAATIISRYVKSIPSSHITALSMFNFNIATAYIAARAKCLPSEIKNVIIWGTNNRCNFPDCRYMFFTDRRKLNTGLEVWLKNILPQHTQNINSRPYRVKSMAYGLAEHCRILWNGSPTNEWTCMTVLSDHSYGIRSDIFFSFPVLCKNRTYEIVQDLVNDEYIKKYIKAMSKLIAREVYFALTICNLKREN